MPDVLPRDAVEPAFLDVTRSITGRRWAERGGGERAALAIAQRLQVPEIVGRVLAGRGVGPDQAEQFLNPALRTDLPDPSAFKDMDKACARLAKAIMEGTEVAVFGDYDVDGATSAALLIRLFGAVGGRIRPYIPDRIEEGYGPNAPALRALAEDGVELVVTVDCGILAFEALEAAAGVGLDVIVIDHHLAEPRLPVAHAVVNPNRLDETGEYGQLAAVGVTFLLAVGVNRSLRQAGWYGATRPEPDLLQWLDLVALGTVCDVVPLTGVNRALVSQGLKVMARRGNAGLVALSDVANLQEAPGTYHAGFILGPRVNAGGRVGKSDLGTRLLATEDAAEAAEIARELDRLNQERRAIESMVRERAMAKVESRLAGTAPGPLVLAAGSGWHPGVIGIVASRLKDRYRRPAFVMSVADGVAKGSGRSIRGVDLGAAVTAARQAGLILDGGGHAMAAGVTVGEDDLAAFEEFISGRIAAQVEAAVASDALRFDGALAVAAATPELMVLLEQAGPFGAGNQEPRFAIAAAKVVSVDRMGTDHLRCVLAGGDGGRLRAVAFGVADSELGAALLGARGRPLHLGGHLRADAYRGQERVRLIIEDAAWA